MQILNLKPFSKQELIEGLKKTFPQYKIQTSFGALQVRTSGFTLTGNVKVDANPETGKISTKTQLDSGIFLILYFPIGIYVMLKKEKIKRLENEVIEGIKKILEENS
ncbi:hypothetical protein M2347_003599 [Chryseobacterium sp. H1D6B]|uniref:hypothetical protein n=1 Tax=Chryseobacterium sp. H1D6B TaxID=2940588 RepID=UPI0015CC6F1E|nr:hypothetical protein [Chryseobacterium sp. H1D6B]MDH6253872.1 hypothetical protein [Chryseobacterium sp. H1D6B]